MKINGLVDIRQMESRTANISINLNEITNHILSENFQGLLVLRMLYKTRSRMAVLARIQVSRLISATTLHFLHGVVVSFLHSLR